MTKSGRAHRGRRGGHRGRRRRRCDARPRRRARARGDRRDPRRHAAADRDARGVTRPATPPSTRASSTAAAGSASSTGTWPSTRARRWPRTCSAQDGAYDVVPYFFSDLSRLGRRSSTSGPAYEWDREVIRGSIDDGAFTVFYLDQGRLAGALTVGRSEDLQLARRLIASGEAIGDRSDAAGRSLDRSRQRSDRRRTLSSSGAAAAGQGLEP